jgi:hypothetical protein
MIKHKAMINKEILQFIKGWNAKTGRLLGASAQKMHVKRTGDLQSSIADQTTTSGDTVQASMIFELQGRFVDMGAGRGVKAGTVKAARAKKWYSPIFYGRVNALQGGLGFKIMEQSATAIKNGIENGGKNGK